jgi:beta-glucosidase
MEMFTRRGRLAGRRAPYRLGLVALAAFVSSLSGSALMGSLAKPWLDTSLTIDQRIALLLPQMTLDEKIGQMTQVDVGSVKANPSLVATQLLGALFTGAYPDGANTPQNWWNMVATMVRQASTTRLGIPILYGVDAVHGDARLPGTTVFPHNIGMGATHDAALVQQACRITAAETYTTGVRWVFGPVVAVPQDVRWGRTYEGYGEQTSAVSALSAACIKGLQGAKLSDPYTVVADPKHFLGDGGTAYGTPTQNIGGFQYLLDQGEDQLTDQQIRTLFLPPYQSSIAAGARIVMASYSSIEGEGKMSANEYWLTEVLKTELGFTGFIVSDYAALYQVNPNDFSDSVAQSINAGMDAAMLQDAGAFPSTLKALVLGGHVPQSRIDDAVTRILRVKFEMGLFESPIPSSMLWTINGSHASRMVAARAVSESAVLLKTSPNALPLTPNSSILLAGVGANDIGTQLGGWSITWQGSTGNVTTGTTLRTGMLAALGPNVNYNSGGNFAPGTHAPVGVVVVAEPGYAEGMGDTATLQLPASELAVIAKVRPLVDKLVVVIMSGRPVMLTGILGPADVIVAAWLPGTEGEGLAAVLSGVKPFTGTLPYTWPKSAVQAPRYDKEPCDGAIFPHGFGLKTSGALLGPKAC